jgi:hypothetical protein
MNRDPLFSGKSTQNPGSLKHFPWSMLTLSLLCVAFLAVLQPVYAHPPSDILLDYDLDSQTLQVTLVHTVSDPTTHYVHRIQITLNGDVTPYEYESQPTDSRFTYQFILPASPGDTVEVKADCNLSGSISGLLIIGGPITVRSVPELWPFHAALMASGLFLAILAANSAVRRTPKTSWLRIHKMVGALGVILVVCGLSLAFYMVSAGGGPHFKVYHAHLGIITLTFTVLTPLVGIISLKRRPPSPGIRKTHIWLSRITLVLLIVTITSGMIQAGLL